MISLFVDLTTGAGPMKTAVIVKAAITEIPVSFFCLLLSAEIISVLQNGSME